MTATGGFTSTTDWEHELGAQVKRARLALDLGQEELAHRANVSLGAVKGLEHGNGSTLKTFVRVVRALGKQDWLAGLEPEPEIGPFDLLLLREGRKAPQRASGKRASGKRASAQRASGKRASAQRAAGLRESELRESELRELELRRSPPTAPTNAGPS